MTRREFFRYAARYALGWLLLKVANGIDRIPSRRWAE